MDCTQQELELDKLKTKYFEDFNDDLIDAYDALLQDLHLELTNLKEQLRLFPKTTCQLTIENEILIKQRHEFLSLLERYAYPKTEHNKEYFRIFIEACHIFNEPYESEWNYDISEAPKDGTVIAAAYDETTEEPEYIRWETNPHHPAGGSFGVEAWVVLPDLFPSDDPIKWRYVSGKHE